MLALAETFRKPKTYYICDTKYKAMLTVRLDEKLEQMLMQLSQNKGLSKSEIVKAALTMYFKKESTDLSPYELGADLFGQEGGSVNDDSLHYKSRLKQKLNEKHTH